MKRFVLPLLAVFLVSAVFAAPAPLEDFRDVILTAARRVEPSVIYIICVQEDSASGKKKLEEVSGSGFLISPDGEFVTNWHVVDKAKSVRCQLADGRHFTAKVIGSDKSLDVALGKLALPSNETVPYVRIGSSAEVEAGQFVVALGAPWGMNRSIAFGSVSCAHRYLAGASEYSDWIQTDAGIAPGNSGGPMINTSGEVIGINARVIASFGEGASFGFAIPADSARPVIDRLREKGKVAWSWSGIALQPLSDFQHDIYFDATNGVFVAGTLPDSPARKAGVRAGDRIVAVNGTRVDGLSEETLPGLRRWMGLLPESEPMRLEVVRDGKPVPFVLAPRAKGAVEGEEAEFKRWDFTAKAINQFETPQLYLRRHTGVYVLGIKSPGNANRSGLCENDIVTAVNGTPVGTLADLKAAHEKSLAGLEKSSKVLLAVQRGKRMRLVIIDFTRDYEKE